MPIVALLACSALSLGAGIDPGELFCEDAVAHLASCCANFVPTRISCYYTNNSSGGCSSGVLDVTYPVLSEAESRCILALDCPTIMERALCPAVAALVPDRDYDPATRYCYDDCGPPDPRIVHRHHEPVCQ